MKSKMERTKTKLKKAMHDLYFKILGSVWLNAIGTDEINNKIIVYVTSTKKAKAAMPFLKNNFWQGFSVEIKQTGRITTIEV